ncbi:hypothetical protein [Thioclava pacifica]|uniref:Uncharacterized protein n=1 Tax=Thioclava pacifica DSM 10166 TaxID=1353537 RepID=A0A074JCS3_9RHOB|nr:hypothetical protein [Thioclava pacifica]KEO53408.1 hypothetical protein TP2_17915 [Thioclava pacifica DSM 10166]
MTVFNLSCPIAVKHEDGSEHSIRALVLNVGAAEVVALKRLSESAPPSMKLARSTIDVAAGLPPSTAELLDIDDVNDVLDIVQAKVDAVVAKFRRAAP